MLNIFIKECKLAIHPFYFVLPIVTGALMLIPQWIYLLVPIYFCLIAVPNLFTQYRANNDLQFSAVLPVRKRDMVKARLASIILLEMLHLLWALIFVLLHHAIYKQTDNFVLNTNSAFFGISLLLYALFNMVLFPQYYKTGYSFGGPLIISITVVVLLAALFEILSAVSPVFQHYMENSLKTELLVLGFGILFFCISTVATYRLSAARFEKVDI